CGNDSLAIPWFKGIAKTSIHEKRFLEIVYYTLSGSDYADWGRFIVCVSQGKLHWALEMNNSDQESEIDQIYTGQGYTIPTYEKENYHITVHIQSLARGVFAATLHECIEFASQDNPEDNESWDGRFELHFDTTEFVFYNTTVKLNGYYTIGNR